MPAVSEAIVREFFEQHGFLVRQQRKYIARARDDEDEVDFFIWNPRAEIRAAMPFVLTPADLAGLARAAVVVRGWHTETFTPGILANSPEIFRSLEPSVFRHIEKAVGGGEGPLTKILVVPALPHGAEARQQSIELLTSKGVDAVVAFHTILADLIEQVETNRNYEKSDLLQVIRILKNYDFLKDPQLELFKARKPRAAKSQPSN